MQASRPRLMPFFNRSNNEDLILAVQSTGVSNGRNGLFLRKRFAMTAKTTPPRSWRSPKKTCSNTAPTAPTLSMPSSSAAKIGRFAFLPPLIATLLTSAQGRRVAAVEITLDISNSARCLSSRLSHIPFLSPALRHLLK